MVTGALIAIGIAARFRHRLRPYKVPCPVWMSFLLENPYMKSVASAEILMDRARVQPGMRILDVGCGAGRIAIPAALRVGEAGAIVALDVQAGMLKKLEHEAHKQGVTNIRTIHSGAGLGTAVSGVFDRVFIVTALGEIPDRPAALREARAALAPDGMLSITEVFPDIHFQTRNRVKGLAQECEFVLEESFGNSFAFTMNFRLKRAQSQ